MGSGVKRKPADRLLINRPIGGTRNGSGGDFGGNNTPRDINNVCPMTLRVRLDREDLAAGAELLLIGRVLFLADNQTLEVGTISPAIMKTLTTCMGLGITYPSIHVVIDKKGLCYAEFAQ